MTELKALNLGPSKEINRVLCLGAHCDDIEIGCGGTILKLLRERPDLEINWIVFSSDEKRKQEALNSAEFFLSECHKKEIVVHNFRDAFLGQNRFQIKELFEDLKSFDPDLIFTHSGVDRHQDHKMLSELSWNTFRNHLILEYEIPKYDADLGRPNCFVPLPDDLAAKKSQAILNYFPSQKSKHWFDEDLFNSLMRLRAIEMGGSERYAEAFHVHKFLLS